MLGRRAAGCRQHGGRQLVINHVLIATNCRQTTASHALHAVSRRQSSTNSAHWWPVIDLSGAVRQ